MSDRNVILKLDALPQKFALPFGIALGILFYFLFARGVLYLLWGPRGWLVGAEHAANGYLIGRVLSSWINLFSLMAFGGAVAVLLARRDHLRRQEAGFVAGLLDLRDDRLILPEDALELRKRVRLLDEADRRLVAVEVLSAGLQRARANWSADEVANAVKSQAELLHGQADAEYATVRYLAWAIPSIGFIGTVLGIGEAMTYIGGPAGADDNSDTMSLAANALGVAFDTTFVALALSLILMYLLYRVQADEDAFFARAADWCLRGFVFKMHMPPDRSP